MAFFAGSAETRREGADGVSLPVRTGGDGPSVVALTRGLRHERFAVVGHDRGSYVALRTALDRAAAVTHLGGRTSDLRGGGRIDSGHHMAEEAPEELAAALVLFLATAPRSAEESGNPA